MMLSDIVKPVSAGAVFGIALTASRVHFPTVIINQMRMQDFHMLEVFLTASAFSAVLMLAFEKAGIAKRSVRSNSSLHWFSAYDGNIIGGVLLGVGMGLTGACPGTVLPQLAQGVDSAKFTTIGALLGGATYAKYGNALVASTNVAKVTKPEPGPKTIAEKFNVSPRAILLGFEMITLSTVALSALHLPGKDFSIMPTVAGGLLIGVAQAVSILLTSSPLGVSSAYEQFGAYVCKVLGLKGVKEPPRPPKSIIFALGVFGGSLALSRFVPAASTSGTVPVPTVQALLGGFILTFGSRMAGGCTSGHGLSGLSSLSYSSLITTTAMFAGGMGAQALLG